MRNTLELNGEVVEYELVRKRVKNINLRIRADGSISVSAPTVVSRERVESFMISKSDFILSALERFRQSGYDVQKPLSYSDGEAVTILGKSRSLCVVEGKRNEAYIAEGGEQVVLSVKDASDTELKRKTFEKWQNQLCREIISELCKRTYEKNEIFACHGVEFPKLHFKTMRTRWGSCNAKGGSLNFNYKLIGAPVRCIEYVVMHEFVHFLHADHSKNFYAALTSLMPDWKERKNILNSK